jgi:hypothetical protein
MIHRDNIEVRPLEEELKDLGLDPEKVVNEIERQSGLLATRQVPNASGLQDGDKTPRSLRAVGEGLVEAKEKAPLGSGERFDKLASELKDKGAENPEALAAWIGRKKYGKEKMASMAASGQKEQIEQAAEGQPIAEAGFYMKKKLRGSIARKAKRQRHREYLQNRGTEKTAAKMYRKQKKVKLKRTAQMKSKKFGTERLSKLHQRGIRVIRGKKPQKEWSDQIATLREELRGGVASVTEAVEMTPYVEAALNASILAMYLSEVFDATGDKESGTLLMNLSRVAGTLHEEMEGIAEPTEEQESKLTKVLDGIIKSYSVYEEMGSPSLGDAIAVSLWEQTNGDEDEDEDEDGEDEESKDGNGNGEGGCDGKGPKRERKRGNGNGGKE